MLNLSWNIQHLNDFAVKLNYLRKLKKKLEFCQLVICITKKHGQETKPIGVQYGDEWLSLAFAWIWYLCAVAIALAILVQLAELMNLEIEEKIDGIQGYIEIYILKIAF